MLLYSNAVFALLCTLTAGSAIKRSSDPCPYHRIDDSPGQPLIEDEYIVSLRPKYSIDQHFQFLGRNLSQHAHKFVHLRSINSYSVLIDEKTLHNDIRRDPGVELVTHNMAFSPKLHWYEDAAVAQETKYRRIHKRWAMLNVKAAWWARMTVKWDVQQSIKDGEMAKADILQDSGKGVDIYVLDSGIRINHTLFHTPGRGSARNFRKQYVDEDFDDMLGHGTFVAGIAHVNAPWSNIVNVKIEGKNSDFAGLIRAIDDVTSHHNFRKGEEGTDWRGSVINMSWENTDLPPFRDAIANAIKAGIQVIASAGNAGQDGGTIPCGYPDVVCVGGVTKLYEKQRTSNYGTGVTLYAPSERLRGPGHDADDSWVWKSGTSMAAPAVAGVASIFISYENIRDNAGTVRERIMQNAHKDVLVDNPGNSPIPNILVHTGLEHPDRKGHWPYVGLSPEQEIPEDDDDNVSGLDGKVDGSNLPDFGAPDGTEPTDVPDSDELHLPAFRLEPPTDAQSTP